MSPEQLACFKGTGIAKATLTLETNCCNVSGKLVTTAQAHFGSPPEAWARVAPSRLPVGAVRPRVEDCTRRRTHP